ncbi:predicted protein [Nematostella vectensis]|uniref:Uncharacterized protein n=1 Tax=Nematostella vectensis TaxID=45351 RepID=A7S0Z8_NEMVE|nr:predicted protein [Nematostella vectensis]|eukprot:XP_001634692.1 predicted protein [Nematostella vectensis]
MPLYLYRYFTRIPHSTASAENHQLAEYIQDKWQQYGVERVVLKKYDALVSVPEEPGYVTVRDSDGQVIFKSAGREKPLLPEENSTRVLPPYSAYSPSGEVTGTLVYAYRGRHKDFQDLEDIGVNVTGKIVIFQYSKSNRASQVLRAQKNGAVGVILYSDPSEVACEGLDKVYPLYNWMPSTGVTRGNIKTTHYSGDPLTPGRPAVDGMYRIPMDEIKQELPQIPVLPISYGDMTYLMGTLDGKVPDDSWRGGLPVDYGIQSRSNNTTTVTLSVKNNLSIKPIYNVIGEIRGVEEPGKDIYQYLVIVGCHRDAWVFGGTDGSSGTAALMEVARVLGELLKKGWRPRRTIVMASWGGEEMGTIGSTEWTEEHAKILSSRALAYINVDMSVDGNATFRAKSVPLMHKVIREAAKKVPGSRGTGTLYEDWVNASPSEESSALPLMERLAFSSDYISFYATQGVPSLDIRYTYDKVKTNTRNNPLYHTLHDTFDLMAAFIDPDFKLQQVTTRAWLQCILDLADSTIIPFGVTDYAVTIEKARDELVEEYGVQLEENKVTLGKY